jgi:uncharacterized protein YqjF (DUF2071 family)
MRKENVTETDRLAVRQRPDGSPIMHQNWGNLHFMHWRINEDILRPHIPSDLNLDTFGESAWIAITPFTIWDVRPFPPLIPALPGLSSMHELNVRTYVHLNGVPGVWFFSLDTDNSIAAVGARTFFHLPYYIAEIDLQKDGDVINYELRRDEDPAAQFSGSFCPGKHLQTSQPGSREFFLTERYVLYTESDGELYRARIHHQPWNLQESELQSISSTMLEANSIKAPKTQPLVHYAEEVNVDIWALEPVANLVDT